MRGEERAKAKGLHGRGREAEALFMVGEGMGRARVRVATEIRGKILFAFPDGNGNDEMIHSMVLLIEQGSLCARGEGLTSPL